MAQTGFWNTLFGRKQREEEPVSAEIVRVDVVEGQFETGVSANYGTSYGNQASRYLSHDGEKYPGGYGVTNVMTPDYWTLRMRSDELFRTNLFARGLIRRLVTNEIHAGLFLESTPEEVLLGLEEDALGDWAERIENLFNVWAEDPFQCDLERRRTFGKMQADIRREALVSGDVLIINLPDTRTGLPRLRVVGGDAVRTPWPPPKLAPGNRIVEGVELDQYNRHVAYWVKQNPTMLPFGMQIPGLDGDLKRISAWGEKSGRRLAWLYYGTDKRYMDVRGEPALSIVLQSIKELDRYRDSALRKATLNAMLAIFVKKTADRPGSGPIMGAAIRKGTAVAADTNAQQRRYNVADFVPGIVLDELQVGEEPVPFSTHGTDTHYEVFERAVLSAIAWAHELPPEILFLGFGSNYSASQASINEFKMYLSRVRKEFGDEVCRPVFHEWLVSSTYDGVVEAEGLLESWRGEKAPLIFQAWASSNFTGNIKPAVDLSKLVHGYQQMIASGLITRTQAARELTGTRYWKNIQKLLRENTELAKALAPIFALNITQTEKELEKAADTGKIESDGSPQGDVIENE